MYTYNLKLITFSTNLKMWYLVTFFNNIICNKIGLVTFRFHKNLVHYVSVCKAFIREFYKHTFFKALQDVTYVRESYEMYNWIITKFSFYIIKNISFIFVTKFSWRYYNHMWLHSHANVSHCTHINNSNAIYITYLYYSTLYTLNVVV